VIQFEKRYYSVLLLSARLMSNFMILLAALYLAQLSHFHYALGMNVTMYLTW